MRHYSSYSRSRSSAETRVVAVPSRRISGLTWLVGALVLAAACFVPYLMAFQSAQKMKHWPVARGVVLQREDVRRETKHGHYFTHHCLYSYVVDGKKYFSTRVRCNSNDGDIVDGRIVGEVIPVLYDPQHPDVAVLDPDPKFDTFACIGLALLLTIPGRGLSASN